MLLETDEVVVEKSLWDKVKSGDKHARHELRGMLHGMVLYMHAFSHPWDDDGVTVVTLRDLEEADVLDGVTMDCSQPSWRDETA